MTPQVRMNLQLQGFVQSAAPRHARLTPDPYRHVALSVGEPIAKSGVKKLKKEWEKQKKLYESSQKK